MRRLCTGTKISLVIVTLAACCAIALPLTNHGAGKSNQNANQNSSTVPGANKNASQANVNEPKPACSDAAVQRLTAEVQRLRKRVADLERERRIPSIHEQLTKEEQRGEALQLRLIDIGEKENNLQRSLEQINQQLRPEQIERALAGVGSVHPEEARDEVRRRLTNEKLRLQSQLDLQRQDRLRTQASLASVDASIQLLRQKLGEAQRP